MSATFTNISKNTADGFIALEDGSNLLKEDGFRIQLENISYNAFSYKKIRNDGSYLNILRNSGSFTNASRN